MTNLEEQLTARIAELEKKLAAADTEITRLGKALVAAHGIPEGYRLVPMEPTEDMAVRGEYVNSEWLNDEAPIGQRRYRQPALAVYKAMLAAAPAQSETTPPVGGNRRQE